MQAAAAITLAFGVQAAYAADTAGTCPNRGDLDHMYCDANKDLVADTPTDPEKLKTPSTLVRSEEHTSELQSLMRISYAVFCLKKQKNRNKHTQKYIHTT